MENEFIKGESLDIQGKIIYPLVRISIRTEGDVIFAAVDPVAVVIEEDSDRSIIPLTQEEINLDETLDSIE